MYNIRFFEKISNGLIKYILREQVQVLKKLWLGSAYGGFYILPFKSLKNGIVFSFGIGEDISFDENLIKLFKRIKIYGFDPTPKSQRWVAENCNDIKNIKFFAYGISVQNGMQNFYLPNNPKFVSGSLAKNTNTGRKIIQLPFKNMKSIMEELGVKRVDILKLDIEGSELDVIPDILKSGLKFTQLCIEIHYRFWEKQKYYKLYKLRKLLNNYGYYIAAVSQSYEEVTFVKKEKR